MTKELELPKGKGPISQASDQDLNYWGKRWADELEKDPNGRWAAQNKEKVEAVRAELRKRNAGKKEAQAEQRAIVAKTETTSLGKAIHDPAKVTEHLKELSAAYHIVSPATRIDMIPEGCGVAVSYVSVDPASSDVYAVGDKFGLSMDTLKRIGAAAALTWDVDRSGRLDNGAESRYCHYRAVGYVKNFDGSLRAVSGEVEIDMREGSPQVEEIREKAKAREKKPDYRGPRDGGESQIREIRKFILRHAESKAKNRAIADMGVKRAYTREELNKPFAVARLMWTGQSDDPETKRLFDAKTADAMIGGMSALYGGQPPSLPQRNDPAPEYRGHEPPPVGRALPEPEDDGDPWWNTDGEEQPPSSRKSAPQSEEQQTLPKTGSGQ